MTTPKAMTTHQTGTRDEWRAARLALLQDLFHLCARPGPALGTYVWLDRAPKARNETGMWWRRHDECSAR